MHYLGLSFAWPSDWNLMLGSLALNVIASFIGIVGGILAAIFIVEEYLEYQRLETQKNKCVKKLITKNVGKHTSMAV